MTLSISSHNQGLFASMISPDPEAREIIDELKTCKYCGLTDDIVVDTEVLLCLPKNCYRLWDEPACHRFISYDKFNI